MSRKNRSKFIAFTLNNSQTCKALFVQHDEPKARQISAHQPQPAATGTAWTAPAPTPPKASTQPQRIAGQHQRTAEERQHPGERAEGDSSTKAQRQHPGEGEDARQGEDSGQHLHPRKPAQQPRPAGEQRDTQPPQPMQSPSQPDSRASTAQEMEGRGQRDGREGKERNGQKMTVKERRPACTPDRTSAQALRPYCQQSQHTRTEDSPGERQRIGESIPLLWSMQNCP